MSNVLDKPGYRNEEPADDIDLTDVESFVPGDLPIVPKFPLVALKDVKLSTARNYLVKGLIPRSGIVVIYGAPKSGKSFITTDLVAHIALGRAYRGRRVRQGPCVYVACEGHAGFPARLEAFRQRCMPEDCPVDPVPFYYVPANLNLIADRKALIQSIQLELGSVDPVAVVIDTLNRSLSGSESHDQDMGDYLRAAADIIEAFGCAVIVVHHSGVDATRPRGHTSLTAAADCQIRLERDGADNLVATVEWMKDGPEGEQILSRLESLEVGRDEDKEAITSCVVVAIEGVPVKVSKGKASKPPKAALTALRALEAAIKSRGAVHPGTNEIPSNAKVTMVEDWRQQAYAMGITSSPEARARQKAFERSFEYLVGTGRVAVRESHVWLVEGARNG